MQLNLKSAWYKVRVAMLPNTNKVLGSKPPSLAPDVLHVSARSYSDFLQQATDMELVGLGQLLILNCL